MIWWRFFLDLRQPSPNSKSLDKTPGLSKDLSTLSNAAGKSLPKPRLIFNTSARYINNSLECWTDDDYLHWKQGDFYPPGQSNGSIAFMILTGDSNLRTRCDVIMCTFGVTIHPSRLFFVGESSSDRRVPIYDVVAPDTPRPVNIWWSKQKVTRGLDVVINMINKMADGTDIKWLMVMDDDTFVSPPNLRLVLSDYDPQQPLMIGNACEDRFCGGGGYVFSRALFEKFPPFILSCYPNKPGGYSDMVVPRCITAKTGVRPTDRREFNTQPPDHYTTRDVLAARPNGFGRAATFHYLRLPKNYLDLWRLHQAFYRDGT
ncbi:unnamed protein product [Rotaria sp. Silwood1]|nr:unnamed protein product [Rotaria sp. Silwood1]CAF1008227.1 unnamed protein product [Rotaria sp. Silwood1]CAF1016941.1 unnamed protein product [Rotaria sp. Silwood1]